MKLGRIVGFIAVMAVVMVLPAGALETINDDLEVTGSVGVGTNAPSQKLHVFRNDGGAMRLRMENTEGTTDVVGNDGTIQLWTNNAPRVTISNGGTLGIGTTVPIQRLHLLRPGTESVRFRLQNSEGYVDFGTDNGGMRVYVNEIPYFDLTSTGRVGIGVANPTTKLDVAGEVKMTVANITGGSDLSEQFDIKMPESLAGLGAEFKVEPGMVVSIDPANPGGLTLATNAYDRTVAGVISGAGGLRTGMVMGQLGSIADGAHPVALTGRVYVYADASNGAIVPGDLLTTSAVPGHAMKVTDFDQAHGATLGKAMSGLDQGRGLVLVLVGLR